MASSAPAWVMAVRPATLTASIAPVIVGTAHAARDGVAYWPAAVSALAGAVCIQIGTNLVNDVEDFERGADDEHRAGPARAVEQGLLSPAQVRRGAIVAFGAAAAFGCYLVYLAGWPILLLGVISILSGVAYTAGPKPLAYVGLGDVFVFVFFGLAAVCGTYFVQAQALTAPVAWSGAAVGALATAILAVNNTRDVANDRRADKRTVAVRFGAGATRAEYAAMVSFAFAIPVGLYRHFADPELLLPLIAAPWAIALVSQVYRADGTALNPLLGKTAQLELAYGALLGLGLIL
jgi:1,4-dihydroxy-2-naphthoate octaprenyltransferase